MTTIPADELVSVVPSVLGAGGDAVDIIGLVLSDSTRVPIGTVASFPDGESVSDYFGATSTEAVIANGGSGKGSGYFGGFNGASKRPGSILFAQYPTSAVSAYLRGGDVSALTLAQLQAISGTLTLTVDGYARAGGSISLAAATGFSSAATIIQTALNTSPATQASFTGALSGTMLTVSAVGSGTLAVGQTVTGSGVTAGTRITALGTGAGGTGTYTVSVSQSISSEAMATTATNLTVTYDSVSGAFVVTSGATDGASTIAFPTAGSTLAPSLLLTSASGAVLSQGASAATPAAFMNSLVAITTNWACFMTAFDPDSGSGNTNKQAFAAWKNGQDDKYAYICQDADVTPTTTLPATASLGYVLANNGDSGTCLIYQATDLNLPAFVMGAAASIDFTETAGRITFAFKKQDGLAASVTDATIATNLGGNPQSSGRGNGYNFYGAYASGNSNFTWFQRGFVTGEFLWLDSYINQIWLNRSFQNALLSFLGNAKSVPYGVVGNALIEAAVADVIQQGLSFGAYAPGTISALQIAEVNTQAGASIASTLQTQGYYLQVLPASSTSRAARTSPPMKFFYLDRGSVQAINLSSVEVQ